MITLADIYEDPAKYCYGRSLWQKDGMRRVYINLWQDMITPMRLRNAPELEGKVYIDVNELVCSGDAIRYKESIKSAILRDAQGFEDIECGEDCACDECSYI